MKFYEMNVNATLMIQLSEAETGSKEKYIAELFDGTKDESQLSEQLPFKRNTIQNNEFNPLIIHANLITYDKEFEAL